MFVSGPLSDCPRDGSKLGSLHSPTLETQTGAELSQGWLPMAVLGEFTYQLCGSPGDWRRTDPRDAWPCVTDPQGLAGRHTGPVDPGVTLMVSWCLHLSTAMQGTLKQMWQAALAYPPSVVGGKLMLKGESRVSGQDLRPPLVKNSCPGSE